MSENEKPSSMLKDLILELVIYGIGIVIVGLIFIITFIFTIGIENLIPILSGTPQLLSVVLLGLMLMTVGFLIYRATRGLLNVLSMYTKMERSYSAMVKRFRGRSARRREKFGEVGRPGVKIKTKREVPLTVKERNFIERAVDYFIDEYGYDFTDSQVRRSFSLARKLYLRLLDMFDKKRAIVNAAATAVKVIAGEIRVSRLPDGRRAVESIISIELNEDIEKEIFGGEVVD